MLGGRDILSASSDSMLAVHLELLSEVLSVDKMLIGGEGRQHIVGVEPVIDPLASLPALVVSAELIIFVPPLLLCTDVPPPIPELMLSVVLVIFSQ